MAPLAPLNCPSPFSLLHFVHVSLFFITCLFVSYHAAIPKSWLMLGLSILLLTAPVPFCLVLLICKQIHLHMCSCYIQMDSHSPLFLICAPCPLCPCWFSVAIGSMLKIQHVEVCGQSAAFFLFPFQLSLPTPAPH